MYSRISRSCAILFFAVAFTTNAFGQAYSFVDIGHYTSGFDWVLPYEINNAGQVSGEVYNPNSHNYRGFVWTNGTMLGLDPLVANRNSYAAGLNDQGYVAAQEDMPSGGGHPYLWGNGAFDDLFASHPTDIGDSIDINNSNHVAGSMAVGSAGHAYLYRAGSLLDLGLAPGFTGSRAFALNDSDTVVGELSTSGSATAGFWWDEATGLHAIPTLGGQSSSATWVNNGGVVVGSSNVVGGASHAFRLENGVMTDIHGLGINSIAYGVNALGDVVGNFNTGTASNGFLWHNGVMVDVQSLMPTGTSFNIGTAYGINDRGQILVFGGSDQAGILTPVPEPASLLALAGAVGLLYRRRSRRRDK